MYFFDTYALVELTRGHKQYAECATKGIITTRLNLMELHYAVLREFGPDTARQVHQKFLRHVIDIGDDVVYQANRFKYAHKSKKLSYIDCVGYMLSTSIGIPFLTGDIQFMTLENVEFVK